jgi:hypothetical protein
MKVEVIHSDEGVQIHLENEDGSKTVWLCDTEQAAIFKLASLLFSAKEDPKQAKRSILIGDFDAPEPEKKALSERAKSVEKRLQKDGLVKKSTSTEKGLEANEELIELLKKMKDQQVQPYTEKWLQPAIHVYPAVVQPQIPIQTPYVGDLPFDGTGYGFPNKFGVIDVNVSNQIGASVKPMSLTNMVLTDSDAGVTFDGAQKIHHFNTSFNVNR